ELGDALLSFRDADGRTYAILGDLTPTTAQILTLADSLAHQGKPLTSEHLNELEFLSIRGAPARSKRLTDLYARRLLAYRRNPREMKERLFTPVWRLDSGDRNGAPQVLL